MVNGQIIPAIELLKSDNAADLPCLVVVKEEPPALSEEQPSCLEAEGLALLTSSAKHELESQESSFDATLSASDGIPAHLLCSFSVKEDNSAEQIADNDYQECLSEPQLLSPAWTTELSRPHASQNDGKQSRQVSSLTSRQAIIRPQADCSVCSATFTSAHTLDRHMRKMHPSTKTKNYSCHVCKAKFHTASNLTGHIARVHERKTKFECEHCNHRMYSSYDVEIHQRIHTKEKPLKCEYCAERFSRKDVLKRHCLRYHGVSLFTEKAIGTPFSCSRCMKAFTLKAPLTDHLISFHLGIRGFPCSLCNRTFKTAYHLKKHADYVHQHAGAYECAACGFVARNKERLQNHVTKHSGFDRSHPELFPHVCGICDAGFVQMSSLKSHARTHQSARRASKWKCSKCPAAFYLRGTLVDHLVASHVYSDDKGKLYECSVCGLRFGHGAGLIEHLSYHHDFLPFQCSACEAGFRMRSDLFAHARKVHKSAASATIPCLWCPKRLSCYELSKHSFAHFASKGKSTITLKTELI